MPWMFFESGKGGLCGAAMMSVIIAIGVLFDEDDDGG